MAMHTGLQSLEDWVRFLVNLPSNILVAQLDRARVFYTQGWGFKSFRGCQTSSSNIVVGSTPIVEQGLLRDA